MSIIGFYNNSVRRREPWNKGRIVGQKRPLKPKDVWAIRVRLEMRGDKRGLALFNLAIDSKLRASDLVKLRIDEIQSAGQLHDRVTINQKKTGRPVQFELTEPTRKAIRSELVQTPCRRPFVFEPLTGTAAHIDSPICSVGPPLGDIRRAR